ncbi:integrase [Streptomyces antimycoticus]|uniref:Integrase n=1 Tax=Streptomyces antimycoticus TaxID=68175 RepID=A0A499ULJ7_9ACTN|nr:tyrosine-type recombinase/integrase [Streptomyces antimycoticus]BBJ42674.1 integrase [Streptomyces antimycoticus]
MVINEDYELHPQAVAYLESLRRRDRSTNTERMYAGRIALYLSYCAEYGVDWSAPGLWQLQRFLHWLVDHPLPPKGRAQTEARFRSQRSANAVFTAVSEFLRFGVGAGWVAAEIANQLTEPKYLRNLPRGFDPGEDGQFRVIQARRVKFRVAVEGYEWLSGEQIEQLIALTTRSRDRFLIVTLACTGMRIGEALGLRREDMHLLSSSVSLGCAVAGPHVHVRRRRNVNGALAKARAPRSIPVTDDLVDAYAEYMQERDRVLEAAEVDFVFVNLFRQPLGRPMRYGNAKELFDRLAKSAGFVARPHMLRHSAATRWVRSGVARDVVQDLLGHVSPSSMEPYLHHSDQDKREAVERVAAARGHRHERRGPRRSTGHSLRRGRPGRLGVLAPRQDRPPLASGRVGR